MMLDRYIGRTLLTHILTTLAGLMLLIAAFSFIEQQDDVGTGRYTLALAGLHTLLLIPSWVADFTAVAVLLGCLTGFGRLQQDAEITAIRAAGYTVTRLVAIAMLVGTLVAGSAMAIGEFAAPGLAQYASRMKTESRYGDRVKAGQDAWWTRDRERILHVERARSGTGKVTLFDLTPDGMLEGITTARGGKPLPDGQVELSATSTTRYLDERTEPGTAAALQVSSEPLKALLRLSSTDDRPAFASLPTLAFRAGVLATAGLDARLARFEVNSRLARVFVAPLLAAIAILGSLGGLRSARQGARLVLGLVVGLLLSLLRDIAQSAVLVFSWPAASTAWLPVIASLAVLLFLAWRRRRTMN